METVIHGECIEVMRGMEPDSVDAIVTDPPYGLEFMGKDWDAPWQAGTGTGEHNAGFSKGAPAVKGVRGEVKSLPSFTGGTNPTCRSCGGTKLGQDRESRRKCACDDPSFPNTTLPRMKAFQAWCEEWATEAFRVLKPGGHILAFGGTRTYHRLVSGMEDAGFEIRDSIHWIYGSGFPKSLDVGKALDKAAGVKRESLGPKVSIQFRERGINANVDSYSHSENSGFGTSRSFGHGLQNIETTPATDEAKQWDGWGTALKPAHEPIVVARKPLNGTVASNVLQHGTGALNIDACRIGTSADDDGVARSRKTGATDTVGNFGFHKEDAAMHNAPGASGRWPANVIFDEDAAKELDGTIGNRPSTGDHPSNAAPDSIFGKARTQGPLYSDIGGPSRYFYCPKASRSERGEGNNHPTVKPQALLRWMCRLVTPNTGVILDPFAGSGTTLLAARAEGFSCIGIEREAEYVDIIHKRLAIPEPPENMQLSLLG